MATFNGSKVETINTKIKVKQNLDLGGEISKVINTINNENKGKIVDVKSITTTNYTERTNYTMLDNTSEDFIEIYMIYSVGEKNKIY